MSTGGPEERKALADMQEVRFLLMRIAANSPVRLRDHLQENSPAWRILNRLQPVPDYAMRRAVVVGWIDAALDKLEAHAAGPSGSAAAASTPEPQPRETSLRFLTEAGIARAQAFLQQVREQPDADRTPPEDLLYGDGYSRTLDRAADIKVAPATFATRREAGAYLSRVLRPVRRRVMNHAGVWSWLGMYYLAGIAPRTLSPNNMTLIFESGEDTSNAGRSEQQTYRHYLWGSWRLYEQHGERAAFLLDQEIASWDDLSERTFGSRQVFSSAGIVQVILHLYTTGERKKRGYVHRPGGLRHLFRVLRQLELTHDVYGMEPDAVLRILPEAFRRWEAG